MKPKVTVIAAVSLDGKLTSTAREPVRFPSRADRAHLLQQRDRADALMSGGGTLRAEDPPMLPSLERRAERRARGLEGAPVRALVTAALDFDPNGRACAEPDAGPIVAYGTSAASAARQTACLEAGLRLSLCDAKTLDLGRVLTDLSEHYGVETVLAEGGGGLNASLFRQGLVDELYLTLCPLVIGGARSPSLCDGLGFALSDAPRLSLIEQRQVEGELFLRYRVRGREPIARRDA